jgi:hypothetical protein
MALTNPTSEDALKLFKDIEQKFPSATLGKDKWEILAVLRFLTSINGLSLIPLDLCHNRWRAPRVCRRPL